MPPESVLAAVSTSVPAPSLVRPPTPPIVPPSVALLPLVSTAPPPALSVVPRLEVKSARNSNDANLGSASGGLTFGGGTIQSGGMLQVGNGGTVGNIGGNGSFGIDRSDTSTFGGVISVTGSFVKAGTGKVILTGSNTYQGGTVINAGTLAVSNDANLGSASGGLTFGGGTIQFLAGFTSNRGTTLNAGGGAVDTNGNSVTLGGTIGGVGGLTKLGAGTLVLTAANTFSGGMLLAAGTLSLANNQALGTGALTTTGSVVDYVDGVTIANPIIVNSSTTQLQLTTGTATQAGVISELNGPRPLEKIGAGTLVLTAPNTYSGPTTISAGTLVLGNGGSILGNVVDNGTFAVNRSDAYTFSGAISGSGSFVQVGTGTTTLSANSTYTGPTTVSAGTLVVNGSIANSAVTVDAGAALTGTGTVGATTIRSGGIFAPGSVGMPGPMMVFGNLVFQSGALYLAQITSSSASIANVTGAASLAGTVAVLFFSESFTRSYSVLSAAGGFNGSAFSALATTNLPAGFAPALSYTTTDVVVNLTAVLGQGAGLSQNQQNAAGALNNFFNNGGTLPGGFVSIFRLTGSNLGNMLSQVSGEAATGAQQVGFQSESQFLNLMLDPFVDGRTVLAGTSGPALGFAPERDEALPDDVALAYSKVFKEPPAKAPTFDQRWSAWGAPMAAATAPQAIRPSWAAMISPPPPQALPAASTIVSRPAASSASRSPAAAPVGAWRRARYRQERRVPSGRLRRDALGASLSRRGVRLRQSLDVERPLHVYRRPSHRELQRAELWRAGRERLSLHHNLRRRYALCRDSSAELPHAGLQRDRHQRRRLRAFLQFPHWP